MIINKSRIPVPIKRKLRIWANKYKQYKMRNLPVLGIYDYEKIIINDLDVCKGDTVFVHTSYDSLKINFSLIELLDLLLTIVGEDGNLMFSTYPPGYSYNFLQSGKIFDVRKTPSATGFLTEIARRHKKARRSLHPTKSVVAIGKNAEELINEHHKSIYPFSEFSPYRKIYNYPSKVIGLGVDTTFIACVHTIDDTYKENFAVMPYHEKIFDSKCINYEGKEQIVRTLAHNMNKMIFNLPLHFKTYLPKEALFDMNIMGYKFYRVDARKYYKSMLEVYENKRITIYKKKFYKNNMV